jgi:DNA-binding IclR family transcriptional regulator
MEDANTGDAGHTVQTARTTFRVLEAVTAREQAGVTELADHLGLAKSNVHNYLATMEEDGYVVKRDRDYHVGLRFLDMGSFARNRHGIYDVAKEEVDSLAEETGELSNLMVEENGMGIYLHRGTGEQAVNVDTHIGHRVHLHNTALGKAMLAHMPEDRVERIIDVYGMPAETEHTITDEAELQDELQTIREEGIAFDREERLDGLRCVAAPVVDQHSVARGAVSVSGPTSRMSGERFESEIPSLLKNASNVIELNLTYS